MRVENREGNEAMETLKDCCAMPLQAPQPQSNLGQDLKRAWETAMTDGDDIPQYGPRGLAPSINTPTKSWYPPHTHNQATPTRRVRNRNSAAHESSTKNDRSSSAKPRGLQYQYFDPGYWVALFIILASVLWVAKLIT